MRRSEQGLTRRAFIACLTAFGLLRPRLAPRPRLGVGLTYPGGARDTKRLAVYFNGEPVTEVPGRPRRWIVASADDREGYLVRIKTPTGGTSPYYLTSAGWPYEIVHGDVRIVELPA